MSDKTIIKDIERADLIISFKGKDGRVYTCRDIFNTYNWEEGISKDAFKDYLQEKLFYMIENILETIQDSKGADKRLLAHLKQSLG